MNEFYTTEFTDTCSDINLNYRIDQLWHLVGNTPMIKLCYTYRKQQNHIYVKCEHYNLTGSIKDRIALYILQQAYKTKRITRGDKIIEVSSGNTGISFSAIGKALGHEVLIIMPDWLSKERTDIIRGMGAHVHLVSKEQGGFAGAIRLAEKLAAENKHTFLPQQFENTWNVDAHYQTTGRELWEQLLHQKVLIDAFVAGIGTGGTIMGIGQFLSQKDNGIKIHPIEPAESPTLSTGFKKGAHRIQGISDEFIPDIVDLEALSPIIPVNDGDAILMAQKLASQLGLGVGISSGANVVGAIKAQNHSGMYGNVVTVFPDCNKKYLSTDLNKPEPKLDGYITPLVTFSGYTPIHRLS